MTSPAPPHPAPGSRAPRGLAWIAALLLAIVLGSVLVPALPWAGP